MFFCFSVFFFFFSSSSMQMQDLEFNSLSIISLNTRGLRDLTKRKALFLFCRRTNADLILLQETHSCSMFGNHNGAIRFTLAMVLTTQLVFSF